MEKTRKEQCCKAEPHRYEPGLSMRGRKGSHGVKVSNPFIIAAPIRVDVMVTEKHSEEHEPTAKEAHQSLLSRAQKYLSNPHELSRRVDEYNRAYKIELIDTDMPLKTVIASLSVESAGANKSKLKAKMQIKAKFGPIGKAMEYLVMKPQLGGAIGDLFAGVEECSKTGRNIQKGYKAKTPALITAC